MPGPSPLIEALGLTKVYGNLVALDNADFRVMAGEVRALIVFGPCRFFGLFGRGEDYYIPWDCVQKFGDDIILIDKPFRRPEGPGDRKRHRWG